MKAAAEPVVNRVYLLSRPALQHFLTLSTRCPETSADATLATLLAVCTEILYLSRVEGLTHQAIADRLGISKSWVEKQLAQP